MFRFKSLKPQLSGAIAYRHAIPEDYVLQPTNPVVEVPPQSFAGPQEFGPSGVSPCCPGAAVADPINVTPVGGVGGTPDLKVVYEGTTVDLVINVARKGEGAGTLIITPTLTDGTALAGTHYQAASPATLNWADGEVGTKKLTIPIIGVVAGSDVDGESTFSIKLVKSGTTTDTLSENEDDIVVSIYDGQ